MSLQACADLVSKGDPDRFRAAMAAPVAGRRVLLPLYAFNVEVARAPWVTSEPMIGEMRLQWWRDALEEIAKGGPVRKHEVTTPMADILDAQGAELLDRTVAARRWDLYSDPFEDDAHLQDYLDGTGGRLMWAATRALGATADMETRIRAYGTGTALARFLMAVPNLKSRGRLPLLDETPTGIRALATKARADMPNIQTLRRALPAPARAGLFEGLQAPLILDQAGRNPERVADGTLGISEFRKRIGLLKASFM
ncbi:MAG: squalene/phytoene synthase family protein [Pseudomonadota bacterium]